MSLLFEYHAVAIVILARGRLSYYSPGVDGSVYYFVDVALLLLQLFLVRVDFGVLAKLRLVQAR